MTSDNIQYFRMTALQVVPHRSTPIPQLLQFKLICFAIRDVVATQASQKAQMVPWGNAGAGEQRTRWKYRQDW